ncbi:MAG TPA: MmgE/PrpD family protein [Burkholderiales bacterium]
MRHRGFHPTSLYGCPAAAAAAGSIAKLNARQMGVALGLAAANAGGLTQHFGTWGKGVHAGNAARAGVTAVLLAEKDYVADPQGLEGDFGFYSAFHGRGNYNLAKVEGGLGPLGQLWSIVNPGLTIKNYPCCGGTLRALDAAQALIRENNIRIDTVERLDVDVHPGLLDIVRFHKPTDGFRGKFSLDYVLAAMLLDVRVDLDTFTDAYCNAPRMRAALEKIRINTHPEWGDTEETRRRSPVTIMMQDGRKLTKRVDTVRGSPANPMTRDELLGKYRGCASRVLNGERLEQSIHALEHLDTTARASDCVDALIGA